MPTPGSGTIGALDYSTEERQKLAKKYGHIVIKHKTHCKNMI